MKLLGRAMGATGVGRPASPSTLITGVCDPSDLLISSAC